MTAIPDKYLDIMQKKAFANLATVMPDGTPQVTPVWFDYINGALRVNTAKGRTKARAVVGKHIGPAEPKQVTPRSSRPKPSSRRSARIPK